jgi:hypothetical protein
MNLSAALTIVATAFLASAQDTPKPGSIEGVIRGAGDGAPLADLDVNVFTAKLETRTDSAGRYTLSGVPPGRHQIIVGVRSRSASAFGTRTVIVSAGQSVTADFSLPLKGSISGNVLDENDEPVPGVEVSLLAPEYAAGAVRYYRRNVARSNDEGEYRMQSVRPGIAYVLLFNKRDFRQMKPISDLPTEPKLRRPATVPTYYPGATTPESATPIALRSGEHREAVNVRLVRDASYCIEGQLTAAGRPTAMTFQIHEAHINQGIALSGGVTSFPPSGETGPDGRIRICDLHPGDYWLSAFTGNINSPDSLATIPVTIRDRDVQNVTLQPVPRLPPIPVELAWADAPPEKVLAGKLGITLTSITRSFGGSARTAAQAAPPAKMEINDSDKVPSRKGPLMDDYHLRVGPLTGRLYLKELLYGNDDVMYAPFRPGSAIAGSVLRVRIGHDGGLLNIRATDADGNPVPNASVIVMPASFGSEADLAARLVTGQADQNGDYASRALMPGKYLVLATTDEPSDLTPEFIAALRAMRNHAREISLEPNATLDLKLQPTRLTPLQ